MLSSLNRGVKRDRVKVGTGCLGRLIVGIFVFPKNLSTKKALPTYLYLFVSLLRWALLLIPARFADL